MKKEVSLSERFQAFIVKRQGCCTKSDISDFVKLLGRKGIDISVSDVEVFLEESLKNILMKTNHCFVCASGPCRKHPLGNESASRFAFAKGALV